jgi:hypothetical protein
MRSFNKVFYVVVSWPDLVGYPTANLWKIESAWDTHTEAVKRQAQIVDGPAEGEYSTENPLGDSNVEVMTYVDLHTRGLDPKKFGSWLHPLGSARPGGKLDGLGEDLHDLSKARAETLLRKLVMQDTQGFFRDNNWAPVHAIFKRLDEAGFEVRNLQTEYYGRRSNHPLGDGKSWSFQVPWTKGGWYVRIVASWAGSATDPSERYDILTQVSYSARLQF